VERSNRDHECRSERRIANEAGGGSIYFLVPRWRADSEVVQANSSELAISCDESMKLAN